MKYSKIIGVVTIGVIIDLVSKYIFYDLKCLEHNNFITPILNTGISRSLPLPLIIILTVSVMGIGAIIRLYTQKQIGFWSAGLLLAGSLGNIIDRIIYSGVRDFIDIQLFNFPIFNFADSILSIGIIIRILQIILEKKK